MSRFALLFTATLLVVATSAPLAPAHAALARYPPEADTTVFRIYKLQQPAGFERYTRSDSAGAVRIDTHWQLAYLGSDAELRASLTGSRSGAPVHLVISGATSTMTSVNAEVTVTGDTARVRDRAGERDVPARGAFPITHYPPYAFVEALYRHWHSLGRPAAVPLLPAGSARFTLVGVDTVHMFRGTTRLQRYAIGGLVWGSMTAWFDAEHRLIGAAHGDAELDRTEALRAGFEELLPLLVARSVADGIAELEATARSIRPRLQGTFAITNVRIVDATGAAPVEQGTIVIRDGRIADVGRARDVRIPAGAPRVDGRGLTALPGLWDMHVHYEQVDWPLASLASGVTTVRDAANEIELITALRTAERDSRILSPRILAAGVIDGGDGPLGVITANTPEEGRAVVRRYAELGFEQIKIYGSLPTNVVPSVIEEAHRHGLTVTGHVPRGMNALEFVRAGADQINHVGFVGAVLRGPGEGASPGQPYALDTPEAQEVIRFLAERGTVIDPSLARGEVHRLPQGTLHRHEPGVALVPLELREALHSTGAPAELVERARASQQRAEEIVRALHRAGVPIVLGSDLGVPAYAMYRELELAVRAGLTPLQAIQAATIVPARAMRMDRESGTLERGKLADIILVPGDPLADISRVRRVRWVISKGSMYENATLWRAAGFGIAVDAAAEAGTEPPDRAVLRSAP